MNEICWCNAEGKQHKVRWIPESGCIMPNKKIWMKYVKIQDSRCKMMLQKNNRCFDMQNLWDEITISMIITQKQNVKQSTYNNLRKLQHYKPLKAHIDTLFPQIESDEVNLLQEICACSQSISCFDVRYIMQMKMPHIDLS